MDNKKKKFPSTFEDKLLDAYWKDVGGVFYLEVPVGNRVGDGRWRKGSKVRRIDAVRLPVKDPGESRILTRKSYKLKEIEAAFRDKDVEVIEAKRRLNRVVFGQAVAGADMFEKQYRPWHVLPVVVYEIDDPAMVWVCRKHGVKTVCPLGKKVDTSITGEEEQ